MAKIKKPIAEQKAIGLRRGMPGQDVAQPRLFRPRKKTKKERTVEDRSNRYAEALGWRHRKMNGLGNMFWPDRLYLPPPRRRAKFLKGILPGRGVERPFWVEFKRAGEGPTRGQAELHADLRGRGEDVLVLDDYEDFVREIKARTL